MNPPTIHDLSAAVPTNADNLRTRHPELLRFIEEARRPMKYHGNGQWTDAQLLASYALARIVRGYHHLPKVKPSGSGVEANIYDGISTWDCNRLTRVVLVAHQMGVRIEIASSGPGRIKLIAHARFTNDDKNCGLEFWERHPSLDHLAKLCGEWKLPEVAAEPAELRRERDEARTELAAMREAVAVTTALAEWSARYPRGVIYSASNRQMDAELIELEERAKAATAKLQPFTTPTR